MIERDGLYLIPVLPPVMREKMESLPQDRKEWPADFREDYYRRASEFTAAVGLYRKWLRKERDSKVTTRAKEMIYFLLDCLNFETGRCDPSQETIADELGVSVRTVERLSFRIRQWVEVTRRGKTTTNFYRFQVSVERVANIIEYADGLRELRSANRARRTKYFPTEPTQVSGHFESEPTFERSHEPTRMSGHEPTRMSDKHKKGTYEGEHKNEYSCSESTKDTLGGHVSVGYSQTRTCDEANAPLPVPRDDAEADEMMRAICDGVDVLPVIMRRMKSMLNEGVLTPNLAAGLLGRRAEAA